MFEHAHMFFSFNVVFIHLKCYTTMMFASLCIQYVEKKIPKNSGPKNERCIIIFNVLVMHFCFLAKKNILIYVLIIQLIVMYDIFTI